jgi:phosphoribosylglycinamide formyltransferase 1
LSLIKNNSVKKKVLVLASGGGTTFEAIAKYAADPSQNSSFEVVGLVVNSMSAGAIQRSQALRIKPHIILPRPNQPQVFFEQTLKIAQDLSVDVIVLAGFLLLVRDPLLSGFSGRILNTHPALLPNFGGKGMYGDRVHEAVIQSGHKQSGVTIHLVNEFYDEGQVLASVKVPVNESDTAQTLADKVRHQEKLLYPKTIDDFCRGL